MSAAGRPPWEVRAQRRLTSSVMVRPSTGGATPVTTARRTCTASLSAQTTLTSSALIVMSSDDQIDTRENTMSRSWFSTERVGISTKNLQYKSCCSLKYQTSCI